MFKFAFLVAATVALLFSSSSVESAPRSLATPGRTIALISATKYCLMLPRKFGGNIADSEGTAISFCNKAIPTAPGAKILPSGFIRSVHFVHNQRKKYVQITGRIDRKKYGLSKNDDGGQYDMNAPHGSLCAGYAKYVQLVEPNEQIYCLRCCTSSKDCPTGQSTKGCKAVIGGDYS
ncbi:hypothetical protein BGZ83_009654 [Gryganskiella cystojenkinii]|nr:hypothetical protein BGZ83_009654 [Gryganskiella cystojenkinii]